MVKPLYLLHTVIPSTPWSCAVVLVWHHSGQEREKRLHVEINSHVTDMGGVMLQAVGGCHLYDLETSGENENTIIGI